MCGERRGIHPGLDEYESCRLFGGDMQFVLNRTRLQQGQPDHLLQPPAQFVDRLGAGVEDGHQYDVFGVHQATSKGRSVWWATSRPVSTRPGEPPHTGSSCSTDSTPSKPPSYNVSTSRRQSTVPRPGTQ